MEVTPEAGAKKLSHHPPPKTNIFEFWTLKENGGLVQMFFLFNLGDF